jgi:predicted NBD/HSP70 family sugar kinase
MSQQRYTWIKGSLNAHAQIISHGMRHTAAGVFMKIVLGIDLGASRVRYLAADSETGEIIQRRDVERGPFYKQSNTPVGHLVVLDSYRSVLPARERLHAYLDEGLSDFLAEKKIAHAGVTGIGISLPGRIVETGDKGDTLFMGANTPNRFAERLDDGRTGINATKSLRKRFPHIRITCDNDCKAVGRAQSMAYGAMGINPNATLYVTISTGIGGGGAGDEVDEDGHIPVANVHPEVSLKCGCGALNCIEALASGQGMAKLALRIMELYWEDKKTFREFEAYEKLGGRLPEDRDLGAMVEKTSLQEEFNTGSLKSEDLFSAMKKGDRYARYVLDMTAKMTACAFTGLAQVHGLERIGVGGGVGINQPQYIKLIQKHAKAMLAENKMLPKGLIVETSPLGRFAGDYGALTLAMPPRHTKKWVKTMTKKTSKTKKRQ